MNNTELIQIKGFDQLQQRYEEISDKAQFKKECGFALQIVNDPKNYKLLKIAKENPALLFQAIYNTALTGLTLNPVLSYAHLIGYYGDNPTIKLMPDYKGLIYLSGLAGAIKDIQARIVYKGDEFKEVLGSNPQIIHNPRYASKEVMGAYAIAFLNGGGFHHEYMIKDEIDKVKALAKTQIVWNEHYPEMAKKTVIKRAYKTIPKSKITGEVGEKIATAISLDNEDYFLGGGSNEVKNLPKLTPEMKAWDGAKKAIIAGNITLQQIRTNYILSEENATKLCSN